MSINIILQTNFVMLVLDFVCNKYFIESHFFKQFTIWNLYILLVYQPVFSMYISIYIFLIFHMFFVIEDNMLQKMLKTCNISIFYFHIGNIVLHVLPALYSVYYIIDHNIKKNSNISLEIGYMFTSWLVLIGNYYNIYSLSINMQHYIMVAIYIINSVHDEKMISIL